MLGAGGWVRCVRRHLPHLSDARPLVLPCPSLSDLSAKASDFSPGRLLCCVTGPFSGSQEIPHSAEVTGGGDVAAPPVHNSSNCCFLFGTPPTPHPFLKIIKAQQLEGTCEGRILFTQTKKPGGLIQNWAVSPKQLSDIR